MSSVLSSTMAMGSDVENKYINKCARQMGYAAEIIITN